MRIEKRFRLDISKYFLFVVSFYTVFPSMICEAKISDESGIDYTGHVLPPGFSPQNGTETNISLF